MPQKSEMPDNHKEKLRRLFESHDLRIVGLVVLGPETCLIKREQIENHSSVQAELIVDALNKADTHERFLIIESEVANHQVKIWPWISKSGRMFRGGAVFCADDALMCLPSNSFVWTIEEAVEFAASATRQILDRYERCPACSALD